MIARKDLTYGEGLLESMHPFIEHLIVTGLKEKTIRNHVDNLWLLGGEIIRHVSAHHQYSILPLEKLKESVGPEGGPYCRHLETESQVRSFDSTCRKLHRFLEQNILKGWGRTKATS